MYLDIYIGICHPLIVLRVGYLPLNEFVQTLGSLWYGHIHCKHAVYYDFV